MVGDTDNVPETLLCKFASATPEHFLCRVIGLDDPIVLVEQQNGFTIKLKELEDDLLGCMLGRAVFEVG